jgi:hypothetical protein
MLTGKNMVFHSYKLFKFLKNIKRLKNNSEGQVFNIDLLFALIIITIIMGMSANALDIAGNRISDYSAGISLDRIATDAADILINTPGPQDWDKSNITPSIKPGLALDSNNSVNSTKILSYNKINQLKIHYNELMVNLLPPIVNSSLTIDTTSSSMATIVVSNNTPPNNVHEVIVVNRTVLVNFRDYNILVRIDESSTQDTCPHSDQEGSSVNHGHNYQNNTPKWVCKNFKVTKKELNTTDFYLITDPGNLNDNQARWMIDRPDNLTDAQEQFQAYPLMINSKISTLMGEDDETVLWVHVLYFDSSKSFTTYIVGVPKGTPSDDIRAEYLYPQPCFFIFRLWE